MQIIVFIYMEPVIESCESQIRASKDDGYDVQEVGSRIVR